MKLSFQRKLDRILGSFLCWFFSFISIIRRKEFSHFKPKHILVILLSEMGSLVLAKPMFDHIKHEYPASIINILVFEQNREVLEIIDVTPADHIITIRNTSLWAFFIDSCRAVLAIRKRKVDTVLDCELFSRISSIYSFLSGAKIRVGFHPFSQEGLYRGDFINRKVLYNPYQHILRQFIALVEAIKFKSVPNVKRQIDYKILETNLIQFNKDEMDVFKKRFEKNFGYIDRNRLILVYPGGGLLPIRAWPKAHFCQISKDLISRGYTIGIIGLQEDKKIANDIILFTDNKNCIDLTGYTNTIRELMILFHFSSLLITNDGGPAHFASMTPISTIVFFGPEIPTLYGTLDNKTFNFYISLPCSPCLTAYNHRNSPCDGDNQCLKKIRPEEVLKKAYEILDKQKD